MFFCIFTNDSARFLSDKQNRHRHNKFQNTLSPLVKAAMKPKKIITSHKKTDTLSQILKIPHILVF